MTRPLVTDEDLAALTAVWMNANAIEEFCWARYHGSERDWTEKQSEEALWLGVATLACVATEMAHECFLAARGKEVHGL